jgi:hypothetical protein
MAATAVTTTTLERKIHVIGGRGHGGTLEMMQSTQENIFQGYKEVG